MNAKLKNYLEKLQNEFELINFERKQILTEISEYIKYKIRSNSPVNLVFICTHNSRRSHIAQIMASASALYYNISGVNTYSAGTEVTEFNPRAVKALKDIGISIIQRTDPPNPIYRINFEVATLEFDAFSKNLNDVSLPKSNFLAIMVCDQANESCPIVFGSDKKIALPYEDPKNYDGTDLEEIKYKERVEDITREMLYIFKNVAKD